MVNYANGKVYKVESISADLVFYSSTTLNLSNRIGEHRAQMKRYKEQQDIVMSKYQKYIPVFKVLEHDDAKIILVANCNCKNSAELKAFEHHYIKNNNCVNKTYMEEKKKLLKERKQRIEEQRERIEEQREKEEAKKQRAYELAIEAKIEQRQNDKWLKQEQIRNEKRNTECKVCDIMINGKYLVRHNKSKAHMAILNK